MAGWVTPQLHHLVSQSVGLVSWWGLLDWLATELHVITHSQAIVLLWPGAAGGCVTPGIEVLWYVNGTGCLAWAHVPATHTDSVPTLAIV